MMGIIDTLTFLALVLGLYLGMVYVIALVKEDNSVIDIAYGASFVLIAWSLALLWSAWTERQLIVLACVTLWGARLTVRIFLKNWGKPEDFRYAQWRETWQRRGMLYFFFRSLGQIYLLQGAVILVVVLPVTLVFSTTQMPPQWFNWIGLAVWCVGFLLECVGDYQLDHFIRNRANAGKIMTTGLWRYSRHPNYFGEAAMWWGLALFVQGLSTAALVFLSPLLITFLLTQVSGIPLLEARWVGRADWEAYKKRTSAFIPWIPKRALE